MKYISTRGGGTPQTFEQVLLTGLAPDGGLYVPAELPHFYQEEIASWKSLSYPELALKIVSAFIGDEIPAEALRKIVIDSYAQFDHPEVAPLTELAENDFMLELYHGPTLAFKDFALQVLGRLLDYVLAKERPACGYPWGDIGRYRFGSLRRLQALRTSRHLHSASTSASI